MITSSYSNTVLAFNYFKDVKAQPIKIFKKTKKILIIEDDVDMSDVISRSLKINFKCSIEVAQDPFEAMNLMTDNFYDLIILDWQLPGLNGTETLVATEKGLKLEPSLPIQWDRKKVPVVIFSSAKKNECLPRKTKHFDYVGFVSKSEPLNVIIDNLGQFIENDKTFNFQIA